LIRSEIRKANVRLPVAARVRRFLNLHKEFDADDEELTRTRKLRRAFLEERYQDLIQAIYGGAEQVQVGTTITYEDGRAAQVTANLCILEVPEG
jgi:long-chain acyl-CoA synthetase